MALIETLNNISKISDGLYEVTIGDALVGAAIDDVENATFLIKNGGRLRFDDNCTTTFTRCIFREEDDAGTYSTDNFNVVGEGRFFEGPNCAPVFKGCQFQINTNGRTDFDVTNRNGGAAPTFRKTELGERCSIIINRETVGSQGTMFNHLASPSLAIDGLIIDHKRSGGACEFGEIPSTLNELTVVDNNPGSSERHVVVLTYRWPVGVTTQTIKKLQARNIGLWATVDDRTVILEDPIGRIEKATDLSNSYRAELVVKRTYKATSINPADNSSVTSRYVITGVDGTALDTSASTILQPLTQFVQERLSTNIVDKSTYQVAVAKYGFQSFVKSITIPDTTNPDFFDDLILMYEDENITETDTALVQAYTEFTTANQIYDYLKLEEETRTDDDTLVGTSYVTALGSILDFGALDVVFDATATNPITHAPNQITIKGTNISGGTFDTVKTTGAVTIINGAEVDMSILDSTGLSTATLSVPAGFDNASVHLTQQDADDGVNAIATGLVLNYSSIDYGGATLWFRITGTSGEIVTPKIIPVDQGTYVFEIIVTSTDVYLQAIEAKIDQLNSSVDSINKNTKLIPAIL